jgi:hypothetical protein
MFWAAQSPLLAGSGHPASPYTGLISVLCESLLPILGRPLNYQTMSPPKTWSSAEFTWS